MEKLEGQIRDLQKELTEIRKYQAVLRLQPCLGDSEMREKEDKFDELEQKAKVLTDTLRDTIRKRQLMLSQSVIRGACQSPQKVERAS